jgi:hypothetical protein
MSIKLGRRRRCLKIVVDVVVCGLWLWRVLELELLGVEVVAVELFARRLLVAFERVALSVAPQATVKRLKTWTYLNKRDLDCFSSVFQRLEMGIILVTRFEKLITCLYCYTRHEF